MAAQYSRWHPPQWDQRQPQHNTPYANHQRDLLCRPDPALAKTFEWTYVGGGDGRGYWPPRRLSGGANLRESPSTTGRVLTTLAEGTAVETLGAPVNVAGQAWQQIRAGSREGWVVAVVVQRQ